MNVEDMKAALESFKRCKPLLSKRAGDGKEDWICWTLKGHGSSFAKEIVSDSIAPYGFYCSWLERRYPGNYSYDEIQAGRHAFVDACIAELERRIAAATGTGAK